MNGKAYVFQGVVFAKVVTEGQVSEFNFSAYVRNCGSTLAVYHVLLGIKQLFNALERRLAAGGHVDQLGDRHNRPNDRGKVADKLHQLTYVQRSAPNEVAAVAENNANDRFNKQGNGDAEQGRELRILNVRLFVFTVQLFKCPKLFCFLNKCLNNGNTREAFLRKIRKRRERRLTGIPFHHHVFADDEGDDQHNDHGNEGKQGHQSVDLCHFENGKKPQEESICHHHTAPAKGFLHGVKVVGKEGHQVANLVDLIIVLRKILAVVKQTQAQVGLHLDAGTKEADAPCKSSGNHCQNDEHHWFADVVKHKIEIKGEYLAADLHNTRVDAVDEVTVKLGDLQLRIVDHNK